MRAARGVRVLEADVHVADGEAEAVPLARGEVVCAPALVELA